MKFKNRCSPEKKAFAAYLRHRLTAAETALVERLFRKQLGTNFASQKLMFGWIVDFYCPEYKLIVEIDGPYHERQRKYDKMRDAAFKRKGFWVLRFTNAEVLNDIEKVVGIIKWKIRQYNPVYGWRHQYLQGERKYQAFMRREIPLSSRLY